MLEAQEQFKIGPNKSPIKYSKNWNISVLKIKEKLNNIKNKNLSSQRAEISEISAQKSQPCEVFKGLGLGLTNFPQNKENISLI